MSDTETKTKKDEAKDEEVALVTAMLGGSELVTSQAGEQQTVAFATQIVEALENAE